MERRTRRYDRRKTWQHSDTARDEHSSMPESRDDDNDPPSVPSRVG